MAKLELEIDEMYPYVSMRRAREDSEVTDEDRDVYEVTDEFAERWEKAHGAFFAAQEEMMTLIRERYPRF